MTQCPSHQCALNQRLYCIYLQLHSSMTLFLVRPSIDWVPFLYPLSWINNSMNDDTITLGLPRQFFHIGRTFLLGEVNPWEALFQPNGYFFKRSPSETTRSSPVSSSRKTPFLENVISLPPLERWWSSVTFACCWVIGYPYSHFSFGIYEREKRWCQCWGREFALYSYLYTNKNEKKITLPKFIYKKVFI